MSWDFIFPTREGSAVGGALERRMLNKVGGAETIRTEIQRLPDGSEVMLRTRGGHPEFTVKKAAKAVQEVYSSWAWPWHGLARYNGTSQVYQSNGTDYTVHGVAPGRAAARSYYFQTAHAPSTDYADIAPPTTSVAGASWNNWAAISNGVLFGENVGMNTWLYSTTSAAFVVVMTVVSVTQITLAFYTLDNWVAGLPESAAADFVKYDKKPSIYMAKAPPSGQARVPEKTLTVTAPAYYRSTSATIRLKRGDAFGAFLARQAHVDDA